VAAAAFGGMPVYTYERLSWWERPTFNQALLGACAALFASALLAGALAWVSGRRRRGGAPRGGLARAAGWTACGMAAVHLLFLGGLVVMLGDPAVLMGDVARLRALLVLPLLGTALAGGVVVCAGLAWRRRLWSLAARLHYTAVAGAAVAFTWFLAAWNLLGFRL
jgi:hypothetical protein